MPKMKFVSATPVITSGSAYATGQTVGGVLVFKGAADGGFSTIYSMAIADASNAQGPLDLLLFNQPLTSTVTDKTAAAINYADAQNCVGVISTLAADYSTLGSTAVAGKNGKLSLFIGVAGSVDNNIYGVLVARGAITYSAINALTVSISAEVPRWDS